MSSVSRKPQQHTYIETTNIFSKREKPVLLAIKDIKQKLFYEFKEVNRYKIEAKNIRKYCESGKLAKTKETRKIHSNSLKIKILKFPPSMTITV